MPAPSLCHKFFTESLQNFHQTRMKSLIDCADGLLWSDKLTVTAIGRHLSGKSDCKHKIKRADRLLSNERLFKERVAIYKALAQPIIESLPNLVIAIDWSGCCRSDYHLLRASLVVDGRAIVLFNQVVVQQQLEKKETHDAFLEALHEVIGTFSKSVYIMSDGGFLTPWYTKVRELGWHFIGRLRGTMKCKLKQREEWNTLKQLHDGANAKPKALGKARLTQYSETACDAYLHRYKGKAKGRTGESTFTKDTKMYRNLAQEPWLLACSDEHLSAEQVVALYKKRMQIEQNFRDDKSQRYGFSWRESKSGSLRKLSLLCLVACLASTALWFVGMEAEHRKWHRKFQANTVKERRVLSFLSLAKQVLFHYKTKVTNVYLLKSRDNFSNLYRDGSVI